MVNKTDFLTMLQCRPVMFTECAIAERLRRRAEITLHPSLFNTPLIYDESGRKAMRKIYGQYRQEAWRARVPILLCAPTWRVDRRRLAEGGFTERLLHDAVAFMRMLQIEWHHEESPVFIGGLIGPANDCYQPAEALSPADAQKYHNWQVDELVNAGVDCIVCQTIPALSEALGLARLLGRKKIQYLMSFVINRQAQILDGTSLVTAIESIDAMQVGIPAGYMVNCAYPSFIQAERQPQALFQRLVGIQANSSSLDQSQLDGSDELRQNPLEEWGELMLQLNRRYGMKILGGCCGTDDRYLAYLASHLQAADFS